MVRRRVRRELSVLVGVVLVLGTVVFFNYNLRRGELWEQFEKMRKEAEQSRTNLGLELLPWKLLQETKGSLRSGGIYAEELLAMDGEHVDIIGFIVPLNQFRDMDEFILLPVPIECYFCRMPPARDVLYVQMAEGETVDYVWQEPILVNGNIKIQQGEDKKFFYVIENAKYGPGEVDGELTIKKIKDEHMQPQHEQVEVLDEGYEPPGSDDES